VFGVCADVGPHGREVELVRAPARQGPVRPLRGELQAGEQRWRDDVGARPIDDERAARRRRFDDPGAGPSHAPPTEAGGEFKDVRHHLEAYYRECLRACGHVSWTRESWNSVWVFWWHGGLWFERVVAGATMTGRLPPGPEGPLAGGAPPPERGPGGDALEAP
jgi:hypothetical protein